jgi:exopolyphosphatase/guanosine-5'-triphosphate,3'-diphosphate pyrophosphatase
MKIAFFDIGTNSIHMLIVDVKPGLRFEILEHEKDMTRLGDGSFEKRRLTLSSVNRALGVIDRFYKIAKKHKVKKFIATATSAVRDAENRRVFTQAVYRKTGIRVQVISGEEEGRLIFLAARSGVKSHSKKALVIDVGGGSMELILGDYENIYLNRSFKLGVTRLTDHFISADPPLMKEIKKMEKWIDSEIRPFIKKAKKMGFAAAIGTAGTMINLASIAYEEKFKKPLELSGHYRLTRKELRKIYKKLTRRNLREVLKMPGLDLKRADIITAGAVLVESLMRLLKAKVIFISNKGIREGAIIDYLLKNEARGYEPGASYHLEWFGRKPFFSGRITLLKPV